MNISFKRSLLNGLCSIDAMYTVRSLKTKTSYTVPLPEKDPVCFSEPSIVSVVLQKLKHKTPPNTPQRFLYGNRKSNSHNYGVHEVRDGLQSGKGRLKIVFYDKLHLNHRVLK
jgi:hypothetical protein